MKLCQTQATRALLKAKNTDAPAFSGTKKEAGALRPGFTGSASQLFPPAHLHFVQLYFNLFISVPCPMRTACPAIT
jgi:hypothetical protein